MRALLGQLDVAPDVLHVVFRAPSLIKIKLHLLHFVAYAIENFSEFVVERFDLASGLDSEHDFSKSGPILGSPGLQIDEIPELVDD
jgi:hypothetical protein